MNKNQDQNSPSTQSGLPSQTEQPYTNYIVLSPDGFPVTDKLFPSRKAAEDFIPEYCRRFIGQGYYAGVDRRIPLDELPQFLTIIPEDELW